MLIVYIGICLLVILMLHRLLFLSHGPAPPPTTYTTPSTPTSTKTKPSKYVVTPELQKKTWN